MKGIPNTERQRLGALLDHETQETVMAMIPQFSETEIGAPVPAPAEVPEELGLLVFNMERGVHLEEIREFLRDCPDIQPFDLILANELDDGCFRSGNKNTARELAKAFGLNYAWGLEFIELVDERNEKGFHGNAVFSRWPIRRAGESRMVSTAKEDLTFAGPGSALERFGGKELSDHTAVWTMCGPK